jgi:hypothetical protein
MSKYILFIMLTFSFSIISNANETSLCDADRSAQGVDTSDTVEDSESDSATVAEPTN